MEKLLKETIKNILRKSLKKSSTLGTYQFYILISIIFLTLGYIREFLFLAFGLFLLYLFAMPTRLLFFKNRPKKRKFSNILEKIDASSIPSLHASRSIFLCIFLIGFFDFKILFSIFIILIFISISYSRIWLKEHYPIDILVGALLGIIVWMILSSLF